MSGTIYLLHDDGTLEGMAEQPYDSEDLLQHLLSDYPSLLAGDQINPTAPREWLLVRRELGVPGEEGGTNRWSLDHLFLDQDAIPTLVEVKRSTDTRIRREVIGQMLDYAANAVVYWPADRIRAVFEAECEVAGVPPEDRVRQLRPDMDDVEPFWAAVRTNLQAGRIRLVFVADVISVELARVIEFLNEQMDPAEVLAVEVRQYVGRSRKTLVPRVFGQTAHAQRKQSTRREETEWNETTFFPELQERHGADAARAARRIFDWVNAQDVPMRWGPWINYGSFSPRISIDGKQHSPFWVMISGKAEVNFQQMRALVPFADDTRRQELCAKLNEIPGVKLERIEGRPSIKLTALAHLDAVDRFLAAFDWYLAEVRRGAEPASGH